MRLSLICAAAGLIVSALAAATPAKADPYYLVRYADTGYCLIWDEALPTSPWPMKIARTRLSCLVSAPSRSALR